MTKDCPTPFTLDEIRANPVFAIHRDDLGFLVLPTCALKYHDAKYVGEIMLLTERELLRAPNTGPKTVRQIRQTLKKLGLTLGRTIEGVTLPDPDFRAELQRMHAAREATLTELQKLAAPPLRDKWTDTARKVLTPTFVSALKDERSRRILTARLSKPPVPWKQLAYELQITAGRISDIEKKVLEQIRQHIRRKALFPVLET